MEMRNSTFSTFGGAGCADRKTIAHQRETSKTWELQTGSYMDPCALLAWHPLTITWVDNN
jgi:hypothetical protein